MKLKFLTILIILAGLQSAFADECMVLGSDPKTIYGAGIFKNDVKKVFERAGFCVSFVNLPVKRIENGMIEGRIDADFFRTQSYLKKMAGRAVKIPTPVQKMNGVILSLSPDFRPKSLKDVKNARIGYIHGFRWHAAIANRLPRTLKGLTNEELIRHLRSGEIKGFLTQDFTIRQYVEKGLLKKGEFFLSEPIMDLSIYIVVAKKNEKFIGKLDAAMKSVLKDGGFRRR